METHHDSRRAIFHVLLLGGMIVDRDDAEGELTRELDAFKLDLFDRTDIVLHTADLTRNRNGCERMNDTHLSHRVSRQAEFAHAAAELLRRAEA